MNILPEPPIENGAGMLQDALKSLRESRYPEALGEPTQALEAGVAIEALAEIYSSLTASFQGPGQEAKRTRFLEALLNVPLTARSIAHYALVLDKEAFADQLTHALQERGSANPGALITRSMFLQAANRLDDALTVATQAINLNVENLDAYFWRADLSRFQAAQTVGLNPSRLSNKPSPITGKF